MLVITTSRGAITALRINDSHKRSYLSRLLSEAQPQPELYLTGRTDCAENLTCIPGRGCRTEEYRIAIATSAVRTGGINRNRKVGMVQQVETLRPKLQVTVLSQGGIFQKSKVQVCISRPRNAVATYIAESAGRWYGVSSRIEPARRGLDRRAVWTSSREWVAYLVWQLGVVEKRLRTGVVETENRRERHIAVEGSDRGNLPSTDQCACEAAHVTAKCLVLSKRKVVKQVEDEIVANIKPRTTPAT